MGQHCPHDERYGSPSQKVSAPGGIKPSKIQIAYSIHGKRQAQGGLARFIEERRAVLADVSRPPDSLYSERSQIVFAGKRQSYFHKTKATNQPVARQMEPEIRGETVNKSNALIYAPK
jgi:hypothetical protein